MKKTLILLILSILLLVVGCIHKTTWNEFAWIEYSFGNQHYEKAAIFISCKVVWYNKKM